MPLKSRSIAFESSNSEGFGGSGPDGITRKFGMPTAWTKGSSDTVGMDVVLVDPRGELNKENC